MSSSEPLCNTVFFHQLSTKGSWVTLTLLASLLFHPLQCNLMLHRHRPFKFPGSRFAIEPEWNQIGHGTKQRTVWTLDKAASRFRTTCIDQFPRPQTSTYQNINIQFHHLRRSV